jgi:hypothetical protein
VCVYVSVSLRDDFRRRTSNNDNSLGSDVRRRSGSNDEYNVEPAAGAAGPRAALISQALPLDSTPNSSQLTRIINDDRTVFPYGVPISVEGDPWLNDGPTPHQDDDPWTSHRNQINDAVFAQQEGHEEDFAYRDALVHFRRLATLHDAPESTTYAPQDAFGRFQSHQPPPHSHSGEHPLPFFSSSSSSSSSSFSYYREFFVEQKRLGGGAFGSVFLVSHVVANHVLGLYAVKKMPANDARRLSLSLSEVRALQSIPQHKNITR